jgi:hypothetical protein
MIPEQPEFLPRKTSNRTTMHNRGKLTSTGAAAPKPVAPSPVLSRVSAPGLARDGVLRSASVGRLSGQRATGSAPLLWASVLWSGERSVSLRASAQGSCLSALGRLRSGSSYLRVARVSGAGVSRRAWEAGSGSGVRARVLSPGGPRRLGLRVERDRPERVGLKILDSSGFSSASTRSLAS